ncbi:TadE/TadG family type IV pilus assembly protein [Marinicrinis sediminis]|uniref:TadE/TadG family type IV pilus assembly protein n=1 Tax=Marinicrinis sediminis TaxID=1652465 RepID=A0ABW5RDE6_9BACL
MRVLEKSRQLKRNEAGSFTLEAAIILPVLLLAVFMFFALTETVYQRIATEQEIHSGVERSAYVWNNSARDLVTGEVHPGQTDGLYWRWTSNDLFGWIRGGTQSSTYSFPDGPQNSGLLHRKLSRINQMVESPDYGELDFNHYWLFQLINGQETHTPDSAFFRWKVIEAPELEVASRSYVVDPIELNRTVDFLTTYAQKLTQRNIDKRQAQEKTAAFIALKNENASIGSHVEAVAYTRKLVGSVRHDFYLQTSEGKRKIDALDKDQVVHQAYYSFTKSSLAPQMRKDAELLKNSKDVNGIVYHFYKKGRNGTVGPDAALRKEIEALGIVVVIHDGE